MLHHQHSHVSSFSRSTFRRDFISLLSKKGLDHVAENILSYLDAKSLCAAELVCKEWFQVISECMLWKKLIKRRVLTDTLWRGLVERRGWIKHLLKPSPDDPERDHMFYRRLYPKIIEDIGNMDFHWRWIGQRDVEKIDCRSKVFCVQYDDHKIVSGLDDNTIKIWDRNTKDCIQVLTGHNGPVQCLQYDDKVIVSGSSDSTVRVWDIKTGELIQILFRHDDAVFHLRFKYDMLVICSKDRSITVWNMVSPSEITIEGLLLGHTDAVNDVDFDEKYIVSASCDRTIKVWNTSTCELVRTLEGHEGGVLCLQYLDRLVMSGSRDKTIKLWDIESGACLRTLEGHRDFVRCIQSDNKRIVSGAYDGGIKVWDLTAALNPCAPAGTLCLGTSVSDSIRVYSLQFDDFNLVSCSRDTILIWNFLDENFPTFFLCPRFTLWSLSIPAVVFTILLPSYYLFNYNMFLCFIYVSIFNCII